MPRNGSGQFIPVSGSWNPATNSNSATAADWNALLADLSTALTGSVASDGETPMTGNLVMGNNKITGLAAATANGDALRLENLIAGADLASATTVTIPLEGNYFKITGTTTITGFASTKAGRSVWITFSGALTLTNSATFVMPSAANVTTVAGDIALFVFDGTNWLCPFYKSTAPAFSAYQSAAQTTAGSGYYKVSLQSLDFDTTSAFDSATNYRYQPKVAGYYQIDASAFLSSPIVQCFGLIYKNGTEYKRNSSVNANGGQASCLVHLNGSTDYIEFYLFTSEVATLSTGSTKTYLQGSLVTLG